jgi:hypothetical protein
MRFRVGVWCSKLGLSKASRKLLGGDNKPMLISTPEMAQNGSVIKN